jgi:hypothetical protein
MCTLVRSEYKVMLKIAQNVFDFEEGRTFVLSFGLDRNVGLELLDELVCAEMHTVHR